MTADDRLLNEADRAASAVYVVAERVVADDLSRILLELVERVRELQDEAQSYRSAICFETTCTNCVRMLDQLASLEAKCERVRAVADAYAEQPDVMEPCGASAQSIRFALDDMPCHCLCHERQGGGVHTGMRCVCNGGEGHD